MNNIWKVASMVIIGAIIADLVVNSQGTKALFDGINGLWSASMKGVNPGSQG